MDAVPQNELLEHSPDDIISIRKLYGLDKPELLDECIKTLQDWLKKQDHFVKKDFDSKVLEFTLVTCKGSIERAKERLDKYCTAKVLHKNMFGKIDLNKGSNINEYYILVLPKYADSFYRITMFKILKLPANSNDILNMYRHAIMVCEYLRAQDYLNGVITVLDYRSIEIVDLLKYINIADTRSFVSVIVDCFGLRIKGIHLLTNSKMVHLFVSLIKQCLSEKLKDRITVHNSLEGLYDYIPKDILPIDYGGKEKSIADLHDSYLKKFCSQEFIELLEKNMEYATEESRRTLVDFNNQYMGTPGSFKRFIVD